MSEVNADAFASETGTVPTVVNNGDSFTKITDRVPSETPKFYTEEDLARVRAQEKDKLYPQIDNLKEELAILKRDREEKLAREAEKEAKRLEEEKKKQEEETDVRSLLSQKEQEWQDRFEQERQEREKAFALLERERAFSEVQNYRQTRLEQVRENIIPELVDLVQGNSVEEIDSSIASLVNKSSSILDAVQQATQAAKRDMVGTKVTSPTAGPLDVNTGTRQFTAEDISSMSMAEYARYRQQLLSDKAQGRSQGLFG